MPRKSHWNICTRAQGSAWFVLTKNNTFSCAQPDRVDATGWSFFGIPTYLPTIVGRGQDVFHLAAFPALHIQIIWVTGQPIRPRNAAVMEGFEMWTLVFFTLGGFTASPLSVLQAQGFPTKQDCIDAKHDAIEQFDADMKKSFRLVCLRPPTPAPAK
jgi:hypothetical protein